MNISVFGLGKLGAPLAAVLASKGHHVIGYDADPAVMAMMARAESPIREPNLDEFLRTFAVRVSVGDCHAAVLGSDISFVVVPTPSDSSGGFSTRHVTAAARAIGTALRDKRTYHLVVLTSTVMPGATAGEFVRTLEEAAGARCGSAWGVCYNPEFIALGSVIRDMLRPDFILIGESDRRAGDVLEQVYGTLCDNNPPVARMTFENAEIAKLSLNTYVTMKIAFANIVADVCERFPAGDVDVVTAAVGLDKRIGGSYLKGGAGYGGPCFPRDVLAFTQLARMCGVDPSLAAATDAVNRSRLDALVERVLEHLPDEGTVGILGLAYKPHTPVVEGSQGLQLARTLAARHRRVLVYDPSAMDNARAILGPPVSFARSAADVFAVCEITVIMTAWDEFRRVPTVPSSSSTGRRMIIDCWRVVDRAGLNDAFELVSIGHGPIRAAVMVQE